MNTVHGLVLTLILLPTLYPPYGQPLPYMPGGKFMSNEPCKHQAFMYSPRSGMALCTVLYCTVVY